MGRTSNYIKINGTPLPPPKRGVSVIVTTNVDAGRNAKGVVVGQRIGRDQYKIDGLEWPWLTAAEWKSILRLMKNFYFNVTFKDPVTGGDKTVKMYCGDRQGEPYWIDSHGNPTHYRDCRVNLIDTGK